MPLGKIRGISLWVSLAVVGILAFLYGGHYKWYVDASVYLSIGAFVYVSVGQFIFEREVRKREEE